MFAQVNPKTPLKYGHYISRPLANIPSIPTMDLSWDSWYLNRKGPFCVHISRFQGFRFFSYLDDGIYIMMTSSNGNIFCVTSCEFTGHRWIPLTKPVTRSFQVFFDLRLNKRLSKQAWGWLFETTSCWLWHHSNIMHAPVKPNATWGVIHTAKCCKCNFFCQREPGFTFPSYACSFKSICMWHNMWSGKSHCLGNLPTTPRYARDSYIWLAAFMFRLTWYHYHNLYVH